MELLKSTYLITLGVCGQQSHGKLPIRLGDIECAKLIFWPDGGAQMEKE